MKGLRITVVMILLALFVSSVPASIAMDTIFAIDFTNSDDATTKATWSEPNKLMVTSKGLGWDGEAASLRDGWIQTIPFAIGFSWRPTSAALIYVSIMPEPSEIVLSDGQKMIPYAGAVYVRYSPDAKHWSTWQVLQIDLPQSVTGKQHAGRNYHGLISVPESEQADYKKLIDEYASLDVPWKSDEDAAVRWILQRQPDFFANHLPFLGYIEFRYEGAFFGGQRITLFKADISYGMSGFWSEPKDKDAYKDRGSRPWSFKADDIEQHAQPPDGGDGKPDSPLKR